MDIYRPLTKLREGYVFTGVCDSVHRGGVHGCRGLRGCRGGMCGCQGVCMAAGGCVWLLGGCAWLPGGACIGYDKIRSMTGGTHPTGMHSCFLKLSTCPTGQVSRKSLVRQQNPLVKDER